MDSFAEKLSFLLKEKSISQRSFAKQVGVSPSSVSLYLKGKRYPCSKTLKKMADVLGTTADDLGNDTSTSDLQILKRICTRNAQHWTKDQKISLIFTLFGEEDVTELLRKEEENE